MLDVGAKICTCFSSRDLRYFPSEPAPTSEGHEPLKSPNSDSPLLVMPKEYKAANAFIKDPTQREHGLDVQGAAAGRLR